MSKATVTIGIPAYNEEINIGLLIKDVLTQEQDGFILEEIIVASDGSTDKTVEVVRQLKDKRILILDNKKREGLAKRENQIIGRITTDVLVLFNADIRIEKDKRLLGKLVLPILSGEADLTASSARAVKPKRIFGRIIYNSMRIKEPAYEEIRSGSNVYTCHGQARGFSKRLYKKINFPSSIGEDAYSYFYCIKNKFKYKYIKNAEILYKLPDNFKDHERQSVRFFQSQKFLSKKFNKEFVISEYRIPKKILIKSTLIFFGKQPIHAVLYFLIFAYLKLKSNFSKKIINTWQISKSSKRLVSEI